MILDRVENLPLYLSLNPGFEKAWEFLSRDDLTSLAADRYEIDGERVFAIISDITARRREDAKLEAHERYIDIQVVLAGNEIIGWKSKALCGTPSRAYNPDRDVQFFPDDPEVWLAVPAGSFAVFFPEDPHMPGIGDGEIRKIVVKVAVDQH